MLTLLTLLTWTPVKFQFQWNAEKISPLARVTHIADFGLFWRKLANVFPSALFFPLSANFWNLIMRCRAPFCHSMTTLKFGCIWEPNGIISLVVSWAPPLLMLRQKNWVEKQTQPARNSNTYIVRQTPLFQTKAQTHNHFHYSLILHFVIQWRLITSDEVEAEVWLKFWSYIDIQRVTVILVIFFIWFVPFWQNCCQRKPSLLSVLHEIQLTS